MSFFNKVKKASGNNDVYTICSRSSELGAKLRNVPFQPSFISVFASPHTDLDAIAKQISNAFNGVAMVLSTTAGELCSTEGSTELYHNTTGNWDNVVVQCFDASIVEQAKVVSVPLDCEDLRSGGNIIPMNTRINGLANRIKQIDPGMDINHRDTLAYVLMDGLSNSESFFMEALYESGALPCLFVGGSAGGTLDFRCTYLHDGKQRLENHAVIDFFENR